MALPAGSQFLITTRAQCSSLDDRHPVFGRVVEGLDTTLAAINGAYTDTEGRPYEDIRIRHTYVLVDPFPDPPGLAALVPPASPERAVPAEESVSQRLSAQEAGEAVGAPLDAAAEAAVVEALAEREDRARAVVLEMIGDLPSADAAPPENVLFVAKLNPVTSDADLELIFSRFGDVVKCDIVRDWKTGDSLCYGFVEFADPADAEAAFFKMNNVLIDDRRIKVDFSQSVSHLWSKYASGGKRQHREQQPQPQQQQRRAGRGGGSVGGGARPESGIGSSIGGAPAAPAQSSTAAALASGDGGGGGRRSRWDAPGLQSSSSSSSSFVQVGEDTKTAAAVAAAAAAITARIGGHKDAGGGGGAASSSSTAATAAAPARSSP